MLELRPLMRTIVLGSALWCCSAERLMAQDAGEPAKVNAQIATFFRNAISQCWHAPEGTPPLIKPTIRIDLLADGKLAKEPQILNPSSDPIFLATAASFINALIKCSPFAVPSELVAYYSRWRSIHVVADATFAAAAPPPATPAPIVPLKERNRANATLVRAYRSYVNVRKCYESRRRYFVSYMNVSEMTEARTKMSEIEAALRKETPNIDIGGAWTRATGPLNELTGEEKDLALDLGEWAGSEAVANGELTEDGRELCQQSLRVLRSMHRAGFPEQSEVKKDF